MTDFDNFPMGGLTHSEERMGVGWVEDGGVVGFDRAGTGIGR